MKFLLALLLLERAFAISINDVNTKEEKSKSVKSTLASNVNPALSSSNSSLMPLSTDED